MAGRLAAERDYWQLAQHGLTPAEAPLRPGRDPASLLESVGAAGLRAALRSTSDLAEILISERLDNLTGLDAVRGSAQVLAPEGQAFRYSAADHGSAPTRRRTTCPGLTQ